MQMRDTLDGALMWFRDEPSRQSAANLLRVVNAYFEKGLIEEDVYSDVVVSVAVWLEEQE